MNVLKATENFERWLAEQLILVRPDVRVKHQHMAEAPFPFFRATFYRWLQLWPEACRDLANAPSVLAVGDLHIENFGTWRDAEGRLIWGVNDLDEAWPAAYCLDLVRLATSAYLAISAEHLSVSRRVVSEAIEQGYRDGFASGGKPFILAEEHRWLRLLALSKLRDPVRFWQRMQQNLPYPAKPPGEARKLIETALPSPGLGYQLKRRVAGLGSLGHPRIVALCSWEGAFLAREAKAVRPSAWVWYRKSSSADLYCSRLNEIAVRVKDPFLRFQGRWLVRRLAPDCSRIELASLPKERDEERLLYCMGWETANMHLGTPKASNRLQRDLAKRKDRWLHKSAKSMFKLTVKEWKEWRNAWHLKTNRRTSLGT